MSIFFPPDLLLCVAVVVVEQVKLSLSPLLRPPRRSTDRELRALSDKAGWWQLARKRKSQDFWYEL